MTRCPVRAAVRPSTLSKASTGDAAGECMTEESKVFGVAHTPDKVVGFTVRSALFLLRRMGIPEARVSALDPFTGCGEFLDPLLEAGVGKVAAYEVRPERCGLTREAFTGRADVRCRDAFGERPRGFNLIIGNPPYGKCAASPAVDERIRETYAARADCVCKAALYDGYVRAIRWASDILESGAIAFVVNNSFLDAVAFQGFRRCVADEFDRVFAVNLRGNRRTAGDRCKREGGGVFGGECRTGVAILFLVRGILRRAGNSPQRDFFAFC